MKSNLVAIYPGKGAQSYQQYSACTTCLPANFIISKCQFKSPVAPSLCPLTKEKWPSQNHVSVSLFPVTTEWRWTKDASSQHRVHPFFPWRRIPLEEQDLGSLLVCSSFCLCVGRFSIRLNQPQHIQSTCNFLSRAGKLLPPSHIPNLYSMFFLSFCFSPLLRKSREMPSCPVHHVPVDASAIQGKMDWSEQIGKAQSQAANHNNISQVVRYCFSFVAYWLTVKSKFLFSKQGSCGGLFKKVYTREYLAAKAVGDGAPLRAKISAHKDLLKRSTNLFFQILKYSCLLQSLFLLRITNFPHKKS